MEICDGIVYNTSHWDYDAFYIGKKKKKKKKIEKERKTGFAWR